jgi:5'-3' exonuclease
LTNTLLVDGNNLIKIGFHGVREFYHNGNHIGGIFHFVNTLKKFLLEHNYDKVIVFWDSKNNSDQRRELFSEYKMNRKSDMNEAKKISFEWQMSRVQQYLEDMFIRQVTIDNCEADDAIAYYCQISVDENKTIFSSDKDLTQLISDNVGVYSPIHRTYYQKGDLIPLKDISIPHNNIAMFKIMSGDKSDNIDGIYLLGEKTFAKLFPDALDNVVSVNDIIRCTEELIEGGDKRKVLRSIIDGKTKRGVLGKRFFDINKKLVDLSSPLINDEGKREVEDYYQEELDPDGRGYQNLMRMMDKDGIFKYLPKQDDAWVEFLQPFLKLTRKEKKRFKNKH